MADNKLKCKALAIEAKDLARRIAVIERGIVSEEKRLERTQAMLAVVEKKQADAGCL